MRVLIVDDEPLARRGLRDLLAKLAAAASVTEASSAAEAARALHSEAPYDVVFLDVQMPRGDGFSLIETIGARRMPPVVFVTAFDEHAVRAFEVNAVDYLLKPVDPDRFREALQRATRATSTRQVDDLRAALAAATALVRAGRAQDASNQPALIHVKQAGRVVIVDPREVEWAESEGNYVRLHGRTGTIRHRATMEELQSQLGAGFVRIRRSTLVRITAVRFCEPMGRGSYALVLHSQAKLTSSRYFRAELAPLLGE